MRISRTTVILLAANLIAFGLLWKATSGHQPAAVGQTQLFPSTPAKLILSEGPERIVLEKRNSAWRLSEPFDWPANIWSVQRLLDELRFVSTEAGFDAAEAKANGSNLKDYGLDAPRWTLKVTAETGATVEARIGVQPSTRHHFLLTEDGKRIIPLPEALAAALAAKPETYRVDKIFEIADFEARAVSVRHRAKDGETVTALISEARPRVGRRVQLPEWRFETPYDALADADATARAVADLTNLRANRFVVLPDDVTHALLREAPGERGTHVILRLSRKDMTTSGSSDLVLSASVVDIDTRNWCRRPVRFTRRLKRSTRLAVSAVTGSSDLVVVGCS